MREKQAGDGKIKVRRLNIYYGEVRAIKNVSMDIKERHITAFIGPSGCGKSTLLRAFNRMNDEIEGCQMEGKILWKGVNILGDNVNPALLRKHIGMVFQKPNPFPTSIYNNVAYGPRIHGVRDPKKLDRIVERSLKAAFLWDEVKDRLNENALSLSGGQQQRLCIARTLAVEPEVLLMDEPTSALDPIATSKIEKLLDRLKRKYTIIMVTHSMQQAARISDYTGFLYMGNLIEFGETQQVFENPKEQMTERYITGQFG